MVTIPPHIMPDIEQHLKTYVGKSPDSLLFPAIDGITHIAPSSLHGDAHKGFGFYHARLVAGRPDFRWHDLRHTGATRAAQAGATTADLMLRIGHSTPQMAMDYQHSDDQRDAEIAVAMSALVDG
jgi:integrase